MSNIEQILNFLKNKPGYKKEGKYRLHEILVNRYDFKVSLNDCAEALKKFNSEDVEEITYNKEPDEVPEGFEVKSMWQTPDGKTLYSYKRKKENEFSEEFVEKLKNYHNSRSFRKTKTNFKTSGVKLHTISDLHLGAYVRDLTNTPNYDVTKLSKKLDKIANVINEQNNKENHIAILGDIIESFTGLNHPNSWKSIQQDFYGANVLIFAYEVLLAFLEKIENLECVYLISGNHDRVTSSNKEDTDGDVAKIIAYFLMKHVPLKFNSSVLNVKIDGLSYILHHGHKGFSNGQISDIVLAYGDSNYFNVLLSGHFHSRNKKEQKSLIQDDKKYRSYVCPAVFTGNSYSENLNFTTVSGFLSINNFDNYPQVLDTPIK